MEHEYGMKIRASCHSDDFVIQVENFDATPWFLQASDEELLALRTIGYGGDYAADEVAEYMATTNESIQAMFSHNHALSSFVELRGFECYVDEDDAEVWIAQHRPHLRKEEDTDG